MPKYVEPAIYLNAFNCPHCGALADQLWYDSYLKSIEDKGVPFIPREDIAKYCDEQKAITSDSDDKKLWDIRKKDCLRLLEGKVVIEQKKSWVDVRILLENIFISKCYSCKTPSIWHFKNLLYPSYSSEFIPNEDLSEDIKKDFEEAAKIYDLSPRGAAALLRLCIQKLCIELGEKGKNINHDIASLVKKGLDPQVQKALDIVRVVGNDAVHPGHIDLRDNQTIANKLFELVNIIANIMLTQPKQINELYDGLPEAKKEAIKNRDNT